MTVEFWMKSAQRKCPICKKEFFVHTPEWVYKMGSAQNRKYYCSWGCMRKAEAIKESRRKRRYGWDKGQTGYAEDQLAGERPGEDDPE